MHQACAPMGTHACSLRNKLRERARPHAARLCGPCSSSSTWGVTGGTTTGAGAGTMMGRRDWRRWSGSPCDGARRSEHQRVTAIAGGNELRGRGAPWRGRGAPWREIEAPWRPSRRLAARRTSRRASTLSSVARRIAYLARVWSSNDRSRATRARASSLRSHASSLRARGADLLSRSSKLGGRAT